MILAKATLVAGPHHEKYTLGASMPAILFINVHTTDEAEAVASRELSERGWATMALEKFKDVTNPNQFLGKDTPEALAFQDATSTGFGLVVYP